MFAWALCVTCFIYIVRASHVGGISKSEGINNSVTADSMRKHEPQDEKINETNLINPRKLERNNRKQTVAKAVTILEFLDAFLQLLQRYDDVDLEMVVSILVDEMTNYEYEGCTVQEFTENNRFTSFIINKLNKFKYLPPDEIRKRLAAIQTKIKRNKFVKTEKNFIDHIKNIYMKSSVDIFEIVLKNFELFRLKIAKINDPFTIARHAVRTLICDQYKNLSLLDKNKLKVKINDFLNYYIKVKKERAKKYKNKFITTNKIEHFANNDRFPTTSKEEGVLPSNIKSKANSQLVTNKQNAEITMSSVEKLKKLLRELNSKRDFNDQEIIITETTRQREKKTADIRVETSPSSRDFTSKHKVFIEIMTMTPFVPIMTVTPFVPKQRKKKGLHNEYKCRNCKKSISPGEKHTHKKSPNEVPTVSTKKQSYLKVTSKPKSFIKDAKHRKRYSNKPTSNVPDITHVTFNPVDLDRVGQSESTVLSSEEISGIPINTKTGFVDKKYLARLRQLDSEMKAVKTQNESEVVEDLKRNVKRRTVNRALLRQTLKIISPLFTATTRRLINTRNKLMNYATVDNYINNRIAHENLYKTENTTKPDKLMADKSTADFMRKNKIDGQLSRNPQKNKELKNKTKVVMNSTKHDITRQARIKSTVKTTSNHENIILKKINFNVTTKSNNEEKKLQFNGSRQTQFIKAFTEKTDAGKPTTVMNTKIKSRNNSENVSHTTSQMHTNPFKFTTTATNLNKSKKFAAQVSLQTKDVKHVTILPYDGSVKLKQKDKLKGVEKTVHNLTQKSLRNNEKSNIDASPVTKSLAITILRSSTVPTKVNITRILTTKQNFYNLTTTTVADNVTKYKNNKPTQSIKPTAKKLQHSSTKELQYHKVSVNKHNSTNISQTNKPTYRRQEYNKTEKLQNNKISMTTSIKTTKSSFTLTKGNTSKFTTHRKVNVTLKSTTKLTAATSIKTSKILSTTINKPILVSKTSTQATAISLAQNNSSKPVHPINPSSSANTTSIKQT